MNTGKIAFPEVDEREGITASPVVREAAHEDIPAPSISHRRMTGYLIAKRAFDIVFSVLLLIVLFPVLLIVPLLIILDSPGPVFYSQRRIGKGGKPFNIYKFRSMVKDADSLIQSFTPEQRAEYEANFKLSDDFRITRVGKILRRTNIDELPQLINILLGQLSFVGPRPVVEEELSKYGARKDLFLSAKPGLTGYWQVNRTPDTTYEERVEMELYYVENRTFLMDIGLLFKTFAVVVCG